MNAVIASLLRLTCTILAVETAACSSSAPPPQEVGDSGVEGSQESSTGDADAYPPGPYGFSGNFVIPDFELDGYRDGKGPLTKLHLHDYYDPTGSLGIRGLLVQVESSWDGCGWCKEDGANFVVWRDTIRARGGRVLQVVVPNAGVEAKTDLDKWVSRFGTNFDVATDPDHKSLRPTENGFPKSYVVDTRTMKIVKEVKGFPDPGVIIGCKTSADCCQPDGKRPGVDIQGTAGGSFCPTHAYACSTLYPGTCVDPDQGTPLPIFDRLLSSNGAAPLGDAGTP